MSKHKNPRPIKRHPRLQPISRANHQGLMFCLLLEKGLRRSIAVDRLAAFTEFFWTNFWCAHRRKLKESLLQFLDPSDTAREAFLIRYGTTTLLWAEGRPQKKDKLFSDLKNDLRAFIRWQERYLFNHIQVDYEQHLEDFYFPDPTHEVCARWSDPFWEV